MSLAPFRQKTASRETYAPITENTLTATSQQPLSTFSIDVDTAAYANVRRFLNSGARPPADAVRLEELINYFPYDYEFPQRGEAPFTVAAAVAEAPWHPTHRLARIAIKARDVGMDRRQSNFVFLVDVSGSMNEPNKLPLVQQSLSLLTDQLTAEDRVAIVVYAGNSGLALSSTTGDQKETIREAIRQMKSGGSTHGSAGIRQAYEEAQKNFIKEGVNRVILCTDGDFNVGTTSPEELEKLITEKAKGNVFLSVLGYGTGNTQDHTMETLADKGNGNYAYIDSLSEARKVLVDQMRGTLITVAKDVKIQVEFNPAVVQSYRLIGYENRLLAKEDFNNDAKDAGEIGAGHTVTALYEIVPVGVTAPDGRPVVDPLKYQSVPAAAPSEAAKTGEMMTVKLRFKKPDGDKSELIDFPVSDENQKLEKSEPEFRFATAVASFGLLLRDSSYRGDLTWEQVRQLALGAKGEDPNGYRGEFIQLIDKARGILGDGRP
jgi:secreted protein with Ig-like and vWFA domain